MNETTLRMLSISLGKKLKSQQTWITCAESCTGGWIAKAITDIAGSSAYFAQGFVTYSNQAKEKLLGVKADTLQAYGAVSEATVIEMAQGALRVADADLAIAVSGIAGPEGGSEEKPVGTVWFAFALSDGSVQTYLQQFSGDRNHVRLQATIFALQIAVNDILEKGA